MTPGTQVPRRAENASPCSPPRNNFITARALFDRMSEEACRWANRFSKIVWFGVLSWSSWPVYLGAGPTVEPVCCFSGFDPAAGGGSRRAAVLAEIERTSIEIFERAVSFRRASGRARRRDRSTAIRGRERPRRKSGTGFVVGTPPATSSPNDSRGSEGTSKASPFALASGQVLPAKIVGTAPNYDPRGGSRGQYRARLARRRSAIGTSDEPQGSGQWVFAIGNTRFGLDQSLDHRHHQRRSKRRLPTSGGPRKITKRDSDRPRPSTPENSGGPLLDTSGGGG